jgi:hypothetical protein
LPLIHREFDNTDVLRLFSHLTEGPAIVLLEDFDTAIPDKEARRESPHTTQLQNDATLRTVTLQNGGVGYIQGGASNSAPQADDRHKYDFNVLLNALDGVLVNHNKVVYFLTTNHIEEIPSSLKDRPSRFALDLEIGNPSQELRTRILGYNDEGKYDGYSLDQLIHLREAQKCLT